MLTTFVRVHRFPMEPAIAKTGRFYLKAWPFGKASMLQVKYVIWSLYPITFLLRSLGFISAWHEQATPLSTSRSYSKRCCATPRWT